MLLDVVVIVASMSRQHLKLETLSAVVVRDIFVFSDCSPVVYINQLAGVVNL